MTTPKVINSFAGDYSFLSNFHPVDIYYEGIVYPSLEHAYQASKTSDIAIRLRIANMSTPGGAKRFGHTIQLRTGWWDQREAIMYRLIQIKFSKKDLRLKLLQTEEAELIEGNTWGDTVWGFDLRTGKGENKLGKLLMKTRAMLRHELNL